jgi:NAD-dependent dihydropyrimidine dehydrogenase PreA subunit
LQLCHTLSDSDSDSNTTAASMYCFECTEHCPMDVCNRTRTLLHHFETCSLQEACEFCHPLKTIMNALTLAFA